MKIKTGRKVLAFVFVVLTLLIGCGDNNKDDLELDSYNYYLKVLNEDLTSDIIVKGDITNLDKALNFRVVNELGEESVQSSFDYGYQAIVIIDLDGTVILSDQELQFIYSYLVDDNKDVVYIGRQYLNRIMQLFSMDPLSEVYEGIGLFGSFPDDYSRLGIGGCVGIWTSEDTETYKQYEKQLTQAIISELVNVALGEAYVN